MKRAFPCLVLSVALAWLGFSWRNSPPDPSNYDLNSFGQLPVMAGGRVKPLDTVARTSLLIIHGRETLSLTTKGRVPAIHWLADTLFNASVADNYQLFVINNADVLGLFGWQQTERKYFSYTELKPFLRQIEEQGALAAKLQSVERSAYQNGVVNLRNALAVYQRLKVSVQPEGAKDWAKELQDFHSPVSGSDLATVTRELQVRQQLTEKPYLLAIPPQASSGETWRSAGDAILQARSASELSPVTLLYAQLGGQYRSGKVSAFNATVTRLTEWMKIHQRPATARASFEFQFNRLDPFTHSMVLYLMAFLLACGSWLGWSKPLARSAFYLLLLALAIHTFGLVARMYLQERPPVTNLYSSAIFIGWGAVIVALILERIFRDGIGAACAGAIGFVTLIVAHHLAGNGDTLEMLQAVLDTNLWLATHVVAITTGYSAMFLAGMLAIIYVVRGVFTRSLTRAVAGSLTRMTYGVVCFATFFSFVGTVLGGIWADQSWGRFWGWDPKENGAVLIVLWCAMILHARWGGFIRERGLMIMALFGNVITSFSWFGVNMLGVGLHSYGFMEKAFPWLCAFVASQLLLMVMGAIPLERWRSFQVPGPTPEPMDDKEKSFTSSEFLLETR
jgi:ABC-type transport system involved in cytochrome c biogenesis permease subunit